MKKVQLAMTDLMTSLDHRTRRERLLIMTAACAVLFAIYGHFVHAPLGLEEKGLSSQRQATRDDITALKARAEAIEEGSRHDPNSRLESDIQRLKKDIVALDERLRRRTVDLVSPQEMARLLEDMLSASDTLELISLENLDPVPLKTTEEQGLTSQNGNTSSGVPVIFRQSLRITFSGNFLHTLDYLRKLENIEQRFFWDHLDFVVEEHPRARISLTVHTLSLNRRCLVL